MESEDFKWRKEAPICPSSVDPPKGIDDKLLWRMAILHHRVRPTTICSADSPTCLNGLAHCTTVDSLPRHRKTYILG